MCDRFLGSRADAMVLVVDCFEEKSHVVGDPNLVEKKLTNGLVTFTTST